MPSSTQSVRRSVALPPALVEQAMEAAPPELRGNFNGLVRSLLEAYVKQRRVYEFAQEMRSMAADPSIQQASAFINNEFAVAENDGLGESDDPPR
ncbi:MAG: hypothetical protein K8R59_14710 [Thermoanaerobaculales bacterium]|nr:hypothetical protein [Thermoanaerobaculales bacterium]